jgi:hypothetical protein
MRTELEKLVFVTGMCIDEANENARRGRTADCHQ